jgi:DNA recombination protein RmuC
MLKTVEMLLKLEKQNKNVAEVVDMVNKLYEKYCSFTDSFESVGRSIESARNSYNSALNQLSEGRGNMSVWFDKIKQKSGITTNKKIAIEFKDE